MVKPGLDKVWNLAGIGTALALAVAVWQGLGAPVYWPSSDAAAAFVNGTVITVEEYELALEAVRRDRRSDLAERDKARILQTLIKEELLVQRAVELGLFETDRGVRKAAVDAMLQFVLNRAASIPSEQELRLWYDSNKARFARGGRFKLAAAYVPTAAQAEEFAETIKDSDFLDAVETVSSAVLYPVPNTLLLPAKLRDYIGPEISSHVQALKSGDIAGPYPLKNGDYAFVWLKEKTPVHRPDFTEIKETVADVWARTAGEQAVLDYMESLQNRAEVEIITGPAL